MEHLTCALAITSCDNRRVNVLEAALLEELVRSVRQVVADAHDGGNQLCAASQMCLRAKELIGVALRGQGVLVCGRVAHKVALVDGLGADLQLEVLTLGRAGNQLAGGFVA